MGPTEQALMFMLKKSSKEERCNNNVYSSHILINKHVLLLCTVQCKMQSSGVSLPPLTSEWV